MPPSVSPRGGMKGGPSCRMRLDKQNSPGGPPFMPILPRILELPKPHLPAPHNRRCPLCHKYGAHCHGAYPRRVLLIDDGIQIALVPRLLCLRCERTYSLLPPHLLRRAKAELALLLEAAQCHRSWKDLLETYDVAWNTLHRWKKLGRSLLKRLPVLLESVKTWGDLSTHLSRWQYPKFLRRSRPTIL